MKHKLYIALGSNLGDRQANLQAAIQALPPRVHVLRLSPIYVTTPWGYRDQPDFLNMVLQAETDLSPKQIMVYLKDLEALLGRQVTFKNGPRVIDLDLLFYDDLVLENNGLTIPHAGMAERAFVLVPLADLAPDFIHPVHQQTVKSLLSGVDTHGVRPIGNQNSQN